MQAIITTQAEFDDLNERTLNFIKQKYGTIADRWSNVVMHPVNGDIAFTVEDKILSILDTAEKERIIELTEDWFPNNEI